MRVAAGANSCSTDGSDAGAATSGDPGDGGVGSSTDAGTRNSRTCPGSLPSGTVIETSFPLGDCQVSCCPGCNPEGIEQRIVTSLFGSLAPLPLAPFDPDPSRPGPFDSLAPFRLSSLPQKQKNTKRPTRHTRKTSPSSSSMFSSRYMMTSPAPKGWPDPVPCGVVGVVRAAPPMPLTSATIVGLGSGLGRCMSPRG